MMRRMFAAGLMIASLVVMASLMTSEARAQCGDPAVPCEKQKKPTATETRKPTATATPPFVVQSGGGNVTLIAPALSVTPALTELPWYQTMVACRNSLEATAIATLGHDVSPSEHETAVAPCNTPAPTTTPFVIAPVAGPVFVPPGVKNVLILVAIIAVIWGGGAIVLRRFKPPSPNSPSKK